MEVEMGNIQYALMINGEFVFRSKMDIFSM